MKQGLRILIVDDFEPFRRELAAYLLRMPLVAEVYQTGRLREAERLVEEFQPNTVLVDVRLEDGSGLDLTKTIRRKHNDIDVIVLSSFDFEEYQRGAASAGALAFIAKSRVFEDVPLAIAGISKRPDPNLKRESSFGFPNDTCCGTILIWHPLLSAREVAKVLIQFFGVDQERSRSSQWQLIRALLVVVCLQTAVNLSWAMGKYMHALIFVNLGKPFA